MLDVITSNKIELFYAIKLGSSSTDGEGRDFLSLVDFIAKTIHSIEHYLTVDVASYFESVSPILENETYKYKESIPEEMIEHDIFVKMPPKKKYIIKAKITSVRKAEPRIVIPEYPYTGS